MNEHSLLAGYRLEHVLGRGTMGTVHYGVRLSDGRSVAVKRVHGAGSDEDHQRMQREAMTLRSLEHPNIVDIIDVVHDGTGIALVMDYAPGGTLTERIARGPVPNDVVEHVIATVADALAHAHRHGIIHRDVKPSNILFNADGNPLLADFGIARNAAHTNLTRTDLAIGTAGYLDPDLADGGEPNQASDQYALAVCAYEALCGHSPFAASTPLAVLRRADLGEYEPLEAAMYGPIANVVMKGMHRNPERRFASMAEFRDAVRNPASADVVLEPIDMTRTFQRTTRSASLDAAAPVKPRKVRRNVAIAGGLLAILAIGGGLFAVSRPEKTLSALDVYPFPTCDPQNTNQCVTSAIKSADGIDVEFAGRGKVPFAVGEPGDSLRVANWFCGERATLALYRPSTGVLYYFRDWPEGEGKPTEVVADRTGILGGRVGVSDYNKDGCADIAIDRGTTRTWFLPVKQRGRLTRVADVK